MATIAVILALGGSAYAVGKLSGKRLKNRSVPAKKLKKRSLGAAEINKQRLGRVNDSARLGGIAASGYLQGSGETLFTRKYPAAGAPAVELLNVAGVGSVDAACSADAEAITWTLHHSVGSSQLGTLETMVQPSGDLATSIYWPAPVTFTLAATTDAGISIPGAHRVIASILPYQGTGPAATFVFTGLSNPATDAHCAIQGYAAVSS
jgi:hypothetical protein